MLCLNPTPSVRCGVLGGRKLGLSTDSRRRFIGSGAKLQLSNLLPFQHRPRGLGAGWLSRLGQIDMNQTSELPALIVSLRASTCGPSALAKTKRRRNLLYAIWLAYSLARCGFGNSLELLSVHASGTLC